MPANTQNTENEPNNCVPLVQRNCKCKWGFRILGQNADDKMPSPKTPTQKLLFNPKTLITELRGILYIGISSVAFRPDTRQAKFYMHDSVPESLEKSNRAKYFEVQVTQSHNIYKALSCKLQQAKQQGEKSASLLFLKEALIVIVTDKLMAKII